MRSEPKSCDPALREPSPREPSRRETAPTERGPTGPAPTETPAESEERRAVRRCLSGSVESFEPLVRLHAQRIVRLAYHFLGDWDEARDLAQETFAKAYLCLDRFDASRSFSTWLCTIAARLATDRLRRRRTRKRVEQELESRTESRFDPDMTLSLKESLARLTPRQRQAVVLCDLHGFTAKEAAEILGCSASTIRVQRFLARGRLRSLLGPEAMGRPALAADTVTENRK